jgi:hypothetical protein
MKSIGSKCFYELAVSLESQGVKYFDANPHSFRLNINLKSVSSGPLKGSNKTNGYGI